MTQQLSTRHDATLDLYRLEVVFFTGYCEGIIGFRSQWYPCEEDCLDEWNALQGLEADGPVYNPPADAEPWWAPLEAEAALLAG